MKVFTPLPIFALLLYTLSSTHEVRGAAVNFGSSWEEEIPYATPMDSEEGSEESFLSPVRVSLPPPVLPDIPSATTIIRVGNASRAIEALGFGDQLSNLEKRVPDLSSPADIQIRYYSLQPNVANPWDSIDDFDEDETSVDSDENKSNEDGKNQDNDQGVLFSKDKQVSKVNYDDYEINDPGLYSEVLEFSSSSTTPGPDEEFVDSPVELVENDKVNAQELGEISNELLDWAFCMKVMKRIMINNATMDGSTSPNDEKEELTVGADEVLQYGLKCHAFLSFARTFGNQFMVKSEKRTATNLDLANYDDTVPNMLETFSPPKIRKVAFHMDNKLIISSNAAPLNEDNNKQVYIVGMPVQFLSDGSDDAEESNVKQESSPFTILNYQKVLTVPSGISNGQAAVDDEDADAGTSDEGFFAQYKIILLGEPKKEVSGKVKSVDADGYREHANDLLEQEDILKTQSSHCHPCADSGDNLRLAALTLLLILLFLLGFLAVIKCLSTRRVEHSIETTDHYVVNILSQTTPKAVNTEPKKQADACIV